MWSVDCGKSSGTPSRAVVLLEIPSPCKKARSGASAEQLDAANITWTPCRWSTVDAQLRRDEQRREERLRVVEPGVGVAEARGKARAQREQEGPANQRQPTEARNVNSRHSGREGDVPRG